MEHKPRGLLGNVQYAGNTSQLEMPFLQLLMSHIAGSHLSKPSGESSKIVSTLTENWRLGCRTLHCQRN